MATNDLQFAAVKHTNVRTDGLVTDEMTVDSQAAPGYWKNDKLVMTLKFSIPKFSFQCQELCSEIWMKTNYDLLHMSQLLFVLTKSPWSDAETLFSNSPLNRLDWRGSIAIYIRSNVVATNIDPIPFLMEKNSWGGVWEWGLTMCHKVTQAGEYVPESQHNFIISSAKSDHTEPKS